MKYVKLAARYYLDAPVLQLTADAEVAYIRSTAYAGDAETSGFIPAPALPMLVKGFTPARGRRFAAELVTAGLWVEVDGGWQLPNWHDEQSDLEALVRRRAAEAERQRRHRDKKPKPDPPSHPDDRDMSRDMSRHESRDPLSRESELELETEPKPPTPLTVVCRLISGDAHATTTDDMLAVWQGVAGPGADLEVEARAFIDHNVATDLERPNAAWNGWLKAAARRSGLHAVPDSPPPAPSRPAPKAPPCPRHPDQPAGSRDCPRCAAETTLPPADYRPRVGA